VSFGTRLRGSLDALGPLGVGIDPHAALLDAWGLPQGPDGLREFGLRVVDAAVGRVAAVKPQVAFFERFGSAGFAALEAVLAQARDAGLIVVADAKRGDIGSTMAGYTSAWLEPGSPLEADAVTLSPYLGAGTLRDAIAAAEAAGKGVFVMGANSNPEAAELQRAVAATGEHVAALVVREATASNPDGELGSVGVVVGATIDRLSFGLTDDVLAGAPILAPGFGAQGATPDDLAERFGALAGNVMAFESRSVLSAGPAALAARIDERAAAYREVRHGGE